MLHIYGIKTCDTCRKARKWLEEEGVEHQWHDLRETPLTRGRIETWLKAAGEKTLVNRRSTTWRQLPAESRAALTPASAADLLLANPTLIKRPVFERDGEVRVGFDETARSWL